MPYTILGLLKKNTHIFAWTVILGFAIWGAGTIAVQQQSHGDVAGYVFGEKVSTTEFERAERSVQLLTAIGNDPNRTPQKIQDEVWKHVTLVHAAKQRGIKVPDGEVIKQIESFFSGNEGFDKIRYEAWIRNVFGENPRAFEEQMRNFLAVQKLLNGYRPKLEPDDEEVWTWYKGLFVPPPPTEKTDEADQTEKKEDTEDAEKKRREEFDKNKEQWKKSYLSFKENEVVGKVVEDIEKQAELKNLLPPPAPPEPIQSTAPETQTALPQPAESMAAQETLPVENEIPQSAETSDTDPKADLEN
ncbi:MAG: SurA N-terminal domain-containing protein [Candidatus Omnitrophica bacterium]|nr:SurA N-terminal domain-containing protein [Candidatus Omnitrophota bacterium]